MCGFKTLDVNDSNPEGPALTVGLFDSMRDKHTFSLHEAAAPEFGVEDWVLWEPRLSLHCQLCSFPPGIG